MDRSTKDEAIDPVGAILDDVRERAGALEDAARKSVAALAVDPETVAAVRAAVEAASNWVADLETATGSTLDESGAGLLSLFGTWN